MAPLTLDFVTLDVFTTTKYAGNPLAVILVPAHLRSQLSQESKQLIAREFNLSETTFLHLKDDNSKPASASDTTYDLDIFTIDQELPFAGHPTIGTATYLLQHISPAATAFVTKAGRIPISLTPGGAVLADIPHDVQIHANTLASLLEGDDEQAKNAVNAALSDDPELREAELQAVPVSIVKGMTFLLIRLPNLAALARVRGTKSTRNVQSYILDDGPWKRGFVGKYYYVPLSDEPSDGGTGLEWSLRTRMVEGNVIPEDPATGSAACTLASYLSVREGMGGRFDIVQGVEIGRKSGILVETRTRIERGEVVMDEVKLGGSTVVVMRGKVEV